MKRENLDADPSAGECCGKAGALPQAGGPPGAGGGQEQPSPGLQGGAALPEAPSPALASSSGLQGWTRVNASPQSCPVDEAVSPQLRKVPAAALLILTTPALVFHLEVSDYPKGGENPLERAAPFSFKNGVSDPGCIYPHCKCGCPPAVRSRTPASTHPARGGRRAAAPTAALFRIVLKNQRHVSS